MKPRDIKDKVTVNFLDDSETNEIFITADLHLQVKARSDENDILTFLSREEWEDTVKEKLAHEIYEEFYGETMQKINNLLSVLLEETTYSHLADKIEELLSDFI